MRDFRNELLEELLTHSGGFIDIGHLLNKFGGDDNMFDPNDQTLIKCRLKINLVLSELKDMKWILIDPRWGFSSSHKLDPYSNRRYFTYEQPVRARLTTLGEVEYKKSKQEQPKPTNEIKIGDGFSGVLVHNSDLSETDFRPITNPTTVQNIEAPSTGTKTSIGKFIMNNIIWVTITTIIGGLIVGFLIYKFGWI